MDLNDKYKALKAEVDSLALRKQELERQIKEIKNLQDRKDSLKDAISKLESDLEDLT